MTNEELTDLVNQHSLTLAEMNLALSQLTRNSLILHESIKSLENTALAHDAQIEQLIETNQNLQQEWQAYLRRLPSN